MRTTGILIKEPDRIEKRTLRILIIFGLLSIFNFFYWFLDPDFIEHPLLYWLLLGVLVFDSFRIVYVWYHYWDISVPDKPIRTKNFTVDVLTTYFPGEPHEMVKETLLAIQRMKYPHTTYLCDEANDPQLQEFCNRNGIIHVTRNNRVDAKAGNINNALKQATGDICLILDPDHIPKEEFLDEVVPYFEDEQIGFVQSVQSYYNVEESLVAKAAAEQTYHFYGPIMMCMNTYGTVNAIGANCVFRRKALDSIGGHAAGLAEDMHTAMRLYAKGWTSVYVPKVFTKGLVPATLASFYKQQLKWSRGTMELLVSVFPKFVMDLNWRQKIHFGILPLHYLSGFTSLICFMIPILSLLTATMPWKGNILNFGLIFAPVFASLVGIRFYVQRWVMDRSEWGPHILGGILLACTWWINIIGVVYTLVRKNVPYLPTPKEDNERTSWKILIPNLVMGTLSLAAIIYGLAIDRTPFTMFMSGFALFNAAVMFFTLVLAFEKPKPVSVSLEFRERSKTLLNLLRSSVYTVWQRLALPIVVVVCVLTASLFYYSEYVKWEGVYPEAQEMNRINYIGIFSPETDNGITSLETVRTLSDQIEENFDIISFYIPWVEDIESQFPTALVDSVYRNHSIPMITWEPWLNASEAEVANGDHVFDLISSGFFDSYISRFADMLKELDKPVFLRFAHEFDNPFYPWFVSGDLADSRFKNAWIHAYELFKKREAHNVIWIWNPWKADNIVEFYPGRSYVDWIGVNVLNYAEYSSDGGWRDFATLYQPYHEEIKELPHTPVVVSEFGTLGNRNEKHQWVEKAFMSIEEHFPEIKSVVYFNSHFDNNWPEGRESDGYLDWTLLEFQLMKHTFINKEVPDYVFGPLPILNGSNSQSIPKSVVIEGVRGVNLKYGRDWRKNYHVLSRRKLLKDFKAIKALGLNTIKISGNTVYDFNILSNSGELGLDVSYGFWIPPSTDFMRDRLATVQLYEEIIQQVERYKDQVHITSWNIQNDILYNQKDFYHKPELLYQNRAYVQWLSDLISEIGTIDPARPVIVDLEVNLLSGYHARMLSENIDGIDFFGLTVKEEDYLSSVLEYFENSGEKYLFSEIDTEVLAHSGILDSNAPFFVTAWQDQYESNKLTFDGLIDRKGRLKDDFVQLQRLLSQAEAIDNELIARILKPARGLYANDELYYYAMIFDDLEGWKNGWDSEGYKFEWSLVKTDEYGNYLAVKDIGTRPELRLRIPENHDYFKLLLTVSNGYSVTTEITTLNTPLVRSEGRYARSETITHSQ